MSPGAGLGAARVPSGAAWGIARVSVGAVAGFAPAGPVRARPRWAPVLRPPVAVEPRRAPPPRRASLVCGPALCYSCSERQLGRILETPKLPLKSVQAEVGW